MRSMQKMYYECQSMGLVSNQREFSAQMWRRSENWFSSTLSRQQERRLSTEALLSFYFSLTDAGCRYDIRADPAHVHAVGQMRAEIWNEIAARVRG